MEKNTTTLYRAPEMCDLYRRQMIGPKADVWALGCVLYKLCTFKDAFGDGTNLQILNVKYSWPPQKKVNQKFKDIVKYCFDPDPNHRPTVRDVLAKLQSSFPEWVDAKWAQQEEPNEATSPKRSAEVKPMSVVEPSPRKWNPFGDVPAEPPQPVVPLMRHSAPPVITAETFDPFSQLEQSSSSSQLLLELPDTQGQSSGPNPFGSAVFEEGVIGADAFVMDLTSESSKYSAERIEQEPLNVMAELILLPDMNLGSALFTIQNTAPHSMFLLDFLHRSGPKGSTIAQVLPTVMGPLGDVLNSRKVLHSNFPEFEGNFSLTNFLKEHKQSSIGKPPICCESAKELLSHCDKVITLLRSEPTRIVAEEAYVTYQVTAFILAKLKQAKISEGYVVDIAIPLFHNQHSLLVRAFHNMKEEFPFPKQPFNFDDMTFLKRIRSPSPRSLERFSQQ